MSQDSLFSGGLSDQSTVDAKTDMSFDDFEFDFSPVQPKQEVNYDVGLGDLAKGVAAGAADFVSGVGELSEQTLGVGAGLRDFAGNVSDYFIDSMSEDARGALNSQIIAENENGLTLGEGAGDIDVWAMKAAQGIGSLIPTMATGGITGAALKGAIARSVTKKALKRGMTEAGAKTGFEYRTRAFGVNH